MVWILLEKKDAHLSKMGLYSELVWKAKLGQFARGAVVSHLVSFGSF